MPYYLDHPEHGAHVCYTLEDVEVHKRIGWVLREEKKAEIVEPKKRGRKPKVKDGYNDVH